MEWNGSHASIIHVNQDLEEWSKQGDCFLWLCINQDRETEATPHRHSEGEPMVREQRVALQKTSLGFKSQPESLQELPLFIASCLQSKEAEEGCFQQKPNFPDTMKALVDGAHFLSKDLLPKVVADFHKAGSQEELCTWGKHRAPSQDHSLGFYD